MRRMRCNSHSICQNNAESVGEWHVSGAGETLEKDWKCKKCGATWREVYVYSCEIDNETEEMLI